MTPPPPQPIEGDEDDSLSRGEIKEAVLRGVRWVTLGRLAAESAAFAGSVVLARLVSPAEFGHAVLAIFLFALAVGLPSGSFGSPLVQAKTLRPAAVRTALTLSLVSGVLVTILVVAVAVPLRNVFDDRTAELTQLAAPLFLIYSAAAVPQALLQRQLDFRRMALLEIFAVVPTVGVSTLGGVLGWGGAAVVAGYLATGVTNLVMAVRWAPPGLPGYSREEAGEILRFGVPFSLSSLLWNTSRNVQLAILSARMPAADVGHFWRASMLAIYYQGKVSTILLRMLFPLLSRARSSDDVQAFRTRMVQVHTTLLFPLLALLVILAPTVIPFLYGDEWRAAVGPAQILAVAGAATVVGTGTGPLMMALGRPDALARYDFAYVVVFAVAVYLAAGSGLTAVAITVAVHAVVFLVVQQFFLAQRVAGVPLRMTLTETLPGVAGCAGLFAAGVPLVLGLRALGAPALVELTLTGVVGLAAYALTLRLLYPSTWRDLATVAGRVLPRRGRRTAPPLAQDPAPLEADQAEDAAARSVLK